MLFCRGAHQRHIHSVKEVPFQFSQNVSICSSRTSILHSIEKMSTYSSKIFILKKRLLLQLNFQSTLEFMFEKGAALNQVWIRKEIHYENVYNRETHRKWSQLQRNRLFIQKQLKITHCKLRLAKLVSGNDR